MTAVLRRAFSRVVTLRKFLAERLAVDIGNCAGCGSVLVGVTASAETAAFPPARPGDCTMEDVLARVVQIALSTHRPNVLAFGFSSTSDLDGGARVALGMLGVRADFPNTVHNSLLAHKWETLLGIVGADVVSHLLLHECVFARLANDCFMQLSGPPLRLLLPASLPRTQPQSISSGVLGKVLPRTVFQRRSRCDQMLAGCAQASKRAARRLLLDIFWKPKQKQQATTTESEPAKKKRQCCYSRPRLPSWVKPLLPTAMLLIKRHQKCNYRALMLDHCSIKKSSKASQNSAESRLAALTRQSTPRSRIVRFLWAAFHKVVPRGLSMSSANESVLRKSLVRFVNLRRKEQLTVGQAIRGMKLKGVPWLAQVGGGSKSPQTICKRRRLLGLWVFWLFGSFFVPLLREFFFCTDTSFTQHRVFFFRHNLWQRVTSESMQLLSGSTFEPLSKDEALRALARNSLGYSTVRILPKPRGVRPIVNMSKIHKSKKEEGVKKRGISINASLRGAFSVLTFLKNKGQQANAFGNSLFSLGEAYQRITDFVLRWKERCKQAGARLPLFFAKCDVHHSFDTIDQRELMARVDSILPDGKKFDLMRYDTTKTRSGRFFVGKFCECSASGSFPQFGEIAAGAATRSSGLVFTDNVFSFQEYGEKLRQLVREHVQCNLIKHGQSFMRQSTGIPQGSILSVILCSLVYGALEPECFHPSPHSLSLLMHFVDDFLCISTDKGVVQSFVERTHAGFPDIGCRMNAAKTCVSFPMTFGGAQLGQAQQIGKRFFIPWCGRLVCTKDLSFRADYSRFFGNHVADSLTAFVAKNPGTFLKRSIVSSIKFRCDPLMLDSRVNNSFTVALNLFQCLLFAAIRFRRHVEFLDSAAPNVRFFKGVVFAAIAAARRRVSELRIKHRRQGFVCKLCKHEQLWLGLRAFHLALRIKRKISPFRQICPFLLRQLKRPEYSPIALRFSVVTTDPSTVAMLKEIR